MKFDDLLKNEPQLEKLLMSMPAPIGLRSYLKNIGAGNIIIRKGEKVRYAYILLMGEVKVSNEFENGRLYIYARMFSTSFIGELEILAGELEHASTVEAVTNCRVLAITAEDFATWIATDPSMLMTVAKGLARKMYPRSSENGKVMFLSGRSKMQNYLVTYYKEKADEAEYFVIDRNRQQIADEIGISIKTVNRCVTMMRDEGLIFIQRGKICIQKAQYLKLLLPRIREEK